MTKSSPKTFLFCPMCGTKYPNDQDKNYHKHCSHCNYTYFENQRTATGAIIIHQQKLLMVKRAIEPSKGMWDFPGGFVEPKEHPQDTIVREVKEELGIDSQVISIFGLFAPNEYLNNGKLNFVCDIFFIVKPISLRITAQDDISSFAWLSPSEFPPVNDLAFPTTKSAMNKVRHDWDELI